MDTLVTRNFRVRGQIKGLFTPEGGSPVPKYIANMNVELWHKGPMEIVLLGNGLTDDTGEFTVDFECESPSPMIVEGQIKNVFVKVSYNNEVLIGDPDPLGGSFD